MIDYKSSKATFVYEILMNRVTDEEIIKGMMHWYFLKGKSISNLADEMHFNSDGFYNEEDIKDVRAKVMSACTKFVVMEVLDESI